MRFVSMLRQSLIVLCLMSGLVIAEDQIEISADLNAFMTLKPVKDRYFEKNFYLGWMGITYPTENWQTVYKEVFQKNDQLLNQKLKEGRVAVHYLTDPIQQILQLTVDQQDHNDLLPKANEIIQLRDILKPNERFLSFKQHPLENEKYLNSRDYFTCKDYLNAHCLTQIKEHQAYIQKTVQDNATLLQRFRTLIEESEQHYALFYNDFNSTIMMMPGSGITKLCQLNIADGILDILNGNVDQGLDKLALIRRWIDMTYDPESQPALIHFLMNITYAQFLDQTMDALLSTDVLLAHLNDERVIYIMQPYDGTIGQQLNHAIIREVSQEFKSFVYPYINYYVGFEDYCCLTNEDEWIILDFLKDKSVILPAVLEQRYDALNVRQKLSDWKNAREVHRMKRLLRELPFRGTNLKVEPLFGEVGAPERSRQTHEEYLTSLDQWYVEYFQSLHLTPGKALAYLNSRYPTTGLYNDYYKVLQILEKNKSLHLTVEQLDHLVVDEISDEHWHMIKALLPYEGFDDYWLRANEQQNYHQLVYLKYLIIKDQISRKNIPTFLESMGNLAKNTITEKLYHFDIKTGVLSTPLPKENKHLPINIKDARLDDPTIQYFKVTLPKK